jgi:hypothetical protein
LDLFVAVSKSGKHVVMHATISRGCPGEPDAEICTPSIKLGEESAEEGKVEKALEVVKQARETGQEVSSSAVSMVYAQYRQSDLTHL